MFRTFANGIFPYRLEHIYFDHLRLFFVRFGFFHSDNRSSHDVSYLFSDFGWVSDFDHSSDAVGFALRVNNY